MKKFSFSMSESYGPPEESFFVEVVGPETVEEGRELGIDVDAAFCAGYHLIVQGEVQRLASEGYPPHMLKLKVMSGILAPSAPSFMLERYKLMNDVDKEEFKRILLEHLIGSTAGK